MSYENIDKPEKPFDFWRGGGAMALNMKLLI